MTNSWAMLYDELYSDLTATASLTEQPNQFIWKVLTVKMLLHLTSHPPVT